MEGKKAIIITIGDELLIGQVMDTNSPWIAQQLELVGIQTIRRWAIPDDVTVIQQSLDEALLLSDYIIFTGGLGPTKDDLTRRAIAQYFGSQLLRNEKAYQHILKIFSDRGRTITKENEDQALVPDNCIVLQNAIGTAPGMWFEKGGRVVLSLPGVPYEMKDIFLKEVIVRIKKNVTGFFRQHRHFLLINVSETDIARKIESVENSLPDYIKLAYLPGFGGLRLRLTGGHSDEKKLSMEMDHFASGIETILGKLIAGKEDLLIEAVIGQLLKDKQLKLGLAESCTGGFIANRITNIPGCSAYFNGGIVCYDNQVKKDLLAVSEEMLRVHGAVSEATVRKMAEQARTLLRVDIALAISGILGPDGGSDTKPVGTVWMAISDETKTEARQFHFYYGRLQNKERAANNALEWMRKWLLELPKKSKAG